MSNPVVTTSSNTGIIPGGYHAYNERGEYIEYIRRAPGESRRMSSPAIVERLSVTGPLSAGSDTTLAGSVAPSIVASVAPSPVTRTAYEEEEVVIREG
jgi:hypothetical protein